MARMGEGRGVHRVLVGKPEGKRSLGRPRRRWEDNIKMDIREMRGGGDWMQLAQDRDRWRALVNTMMNFRVPESAGNFLTSCRTSQLIKKALLHGVSKFRSGYSVLLSCSVYCLCVNLYCTTAIGCQPNCS